MPDFSGTSLSCWSEMIWRILSLRFPSIDEKQGLIWVSEFLDTVEVLGRNMNADTATAFLNWEVLMGHWLNSRSLSLQLPRKYCRRGFDLGKRKRGQYKFLACSHTTHSLPYHFPFLCLSFQEFPGSWYPGRRNDVFKNSWSPTLMYYEHKAMIQPADLQKKYQTTDLHFSFPLSNAHPSPSCPVENPMK